MAALSEKILWPLVGIFIFGVLAGFYINDRRRLAEEETTKVSNQQASTEQSKTSNSTSSNKPSYTSNKNTTTTAPSVNSASYNQTSGATSMSIDEYLTQIANTRSKQLKKNALHHQGFSGSIDEYLNGNYSATQKLTKSESSENNKQSPHHNQQISDATSMTMDEYLAKTQNKSHAKVSNDSAYHGGIDEYLAKYGDGAQTAVKKSSSDPFNKKEHIGFHGSYEEYAKKYN